MIKWAQEKGEREREEVQCRKGSAVRKTDTLARFSLKFGGRVQGVLLAPYASRCLGRRPFGICATMLKRWRDRERENEADCMMGQGCRKRNCASTLDRV